jgi:hypothetical protein
MVLLLHLTIAEAGMVRRRQATGKHITEDDGGEYISKVSGFLDKQDLA